MKCPICGSLEIVGKYFPFCSERCQLIDLYSWFNGDYGFYEPVPIPNVEDDDDSDPSWGN